MLPIAKLGVPEFPYSGKYETPFLPRCQVFSISWNFQFLSTEDLNPSICPDCERATLIGFYTCAICSSFGAGFPAQPFSG